MRQKWKTGDVFTIDLRPGTAVLGTVLLDQKRIGNTAILGFSLVQASQNRTLQEQDLVSVQFVTRENLDKGRWKVVDHIAPISDSSYFDTAALEATGYIGVKCIGGGVMHKFMEACLGLRGWNSFADPEYFSKLLLPNVAVPDQAVFV